MRNLIGFALVLLTVAATASTDDLLHYSGRVDIDPAGGSLSADLTIQIPLAPETRSIPFLISGRLATTEISGRGVTGFERAPMAPDAPWDQIVVTLDDATDRETVLLNFVYAGQPSMPENGINQISPTWVELSVDSAWHPVVATIDREMTIDIEVGLPTDWNVVSSAVATPTGSGFRLVNNIPHADIAFAAGPGLAVDTGPGFRVYHRGESPATIDRVLAAASRCRVYLDTWFGETDSLPDASFVITDRTEGGYARKNFIALTRVADTENIPLTAFLCHELSHYWSSGAKPLTVDNWLNEGFAVLVAARAMRAFYGEEAWLETVAGWKERAADQGSVWTPDDPSRRSFEVNYKKAPLVLLSLEDKIGAAAFDQLLRRYMTDSIDDTPALLDAVEAIAGADARAWFADALAR